MWSKPIANPTQAISPRGAMERNLGTKCPQRRVQERYFSYSEMHDTSFFFFIYLFFHFFYIIYLLLFYIKFINYFFIIKSYFYFSCFLMFRDILECSGMLCVPGFIDGLTTVAKTFLKKRTYCCFKMICRSYSSTSFNFSNVGDFFRVEF